MFSGEKRQQVSTGKTNLLRRLRAVFRQSPPIAPDRPFYVIGDVHGRFDLLGQLLKQLESGHEVVLAGDYVDRGDSSAAVLRFLADQPQMTCLMGNHEAMMLEFLDDPVANAPFWFRHGGLETLRSFSIANPEADLSRDGLIGLRDQLAAAMGTELITWLRNLPLWYRNGNVAVVHAGADPSRPIENQLPHHLLWGHSDFHRKPRRDGIWVVHGHTIVPAPSVRHGRVAIDTGAYASDRLSAALLRAGSLSFETTQPSAP
jgi:serine/threonine protein phosphatase 1